MPPLTKNQIWIKQVCSCFRSPPPPPRTESPADDKTEDGPVTSSSGLTPEVTLSEPETEESKAKAATVEENAPATASTATVVTSTECVAEVTSSEDKSTTEAAATMLELGQQNSEQTGKYNLIKKNCYERNPLFESFRELNLMGCSDGQIQNNESILEYLIFCP